MATITAAGAVRAAVSTVLDTFLVHGLGRAGTNGTPHKVTESAAPPSTPPQSPHKPDTRRARRVSVSGASLADRPAPLPQ
ncbi:hypothetical protein GCM10010353_03950 [Streptomyces chryseus]|nr:hypothetical protein GCM10010353_03950 [Streptomyces chryseus]